MQIVRQFYLLLIFCSVIDFHKRILGGILGFLHMDCVSWFEFMSQTCDFGCGFLVFGCFRQLFNLICLFLFINLGLKIFQFGFHCKGLFTILYDFSGKSGDLMKNGSFLLEMVKKLEPKLKLNSESNGQVDDELDDSSGGDLGNADGMFDVVLLRKMVKRERQRVRDAYSELDKERLAAATAAAEAMAMIVRLQNEKSLIEMEANHYHRLVEEKQIHDQEVIQSLRWIVLKHKSERKHMEDQLRFYKRRLRILSKGDDRDICEDNNECTSLFNLSTGEDSPFDGLISSLDFDLSPLIRCRIVTQETG